MLPVPPFFRSQMAANKEKRIRGKSGSHTGNYIPDELLFEILVRLPAQDIYFGARLVCWKWYHMTNTKNFIHKHLEHASYGLLYRDKSYKNLVFMTASREEGGGTVETYTLNYEKRTPILSSWNGLALQYDGNFKRSTYRVTNVLTGQILRLPPCPYYMDRWRLGGMGFDQASTTYKVVVTCIEAREYGCAIFTVGVDKSWRIVPTDHLSCHGKFTLQSTPITTEGFVHWKRDYDTKVVTLNLKTERITETSPPKVENGNTQTWYFSTGRHLSLFIRRERLDWEIFELKPETGEWRKFAYICLEPHQKRTKMHGFIEPFGWLKYPEVLAFKVDYDDMIIFYNLITCEIDVKTLSAGAVLITLHKNSMEWLCGP